MKKLKVAESLAWNELAIDVKNIVHTGDTSNIDWNNEFVGQYSAKKILILNRPMLNGLFSYNCFNDLWRK